MPTEPSKEAVEARLKQYTDRNPGMSGDEVDELRHELRGELARQLEVVLPIELEKARQRWEQEIRERLLRKVAESTAAPSNVVPSDGYQRGRADERQAWQSALDSIGVEAEPVEDCETCDGKGIIHTGECREAMSGPTCRNPACPPCNTPETEPCPDCQSDGGER